MSFQRPEFLLALLLALLPAAFYLSRYVRSTRTVFPAAHYLFGKDRTPLARLRSRQIIATLLRAAIICLAALAFAGPVLPERPTTAPPPQGSRAVLLFDTSASMTATSKEGKSLLAALVVEAQAVVSSASDESLVAIVPCPRPQENLVWLPRDEALVALARLESSWTTCRPASLLEHLLNALPAETNFHLFSDLDVDDEEWSHLTSLLEAASNVKVHQPASSPTANRAVADLWPIPGGVGLLLETTARDMPASEATIRCPGHEATSPVPALTTAGAAVSVTIPANLAPGLCQITLADDALHYDNSAWFEAGAPEPTRVLVVDGSPGHSVVASPGGFLTAALRAGEAPVRLFHLAQTEFSFDSLRLADLLVLVDPRPLPEYMQKGLVEFMARGKQVWLFAGNAMAEWESDNLLLPGLQSRRCVSLPEQPFQIEWATPDDPSMAAIKALPETSLRAWTHIRHTALTFLGREVAVLARFDDGVPLLVRVPFARGQLLLWSLIPAVDNGNFALHPAFPLTVQAVLAQLAPPQSLVQVPPTCTVGQPCDLPGLFDASGESYAEGGQTSQRVTLSSQEELVCPEPGPYFTPGPEGRNLAFVCRGRRSEAEGAQMRELPLPKEPLPTSGLYRSSSPTPIAQLLLLAALLLVFVELWMVSGRLKDRYEA